jgi:hypothetical protein
MKYGRLAPESRYDPNRLVVQSPISWWYHRPADKPRSTRSSWHGTGPDIFDWESVGSRCGSIGSSNSETFQVKCFACCRITFQQYTLLHCQRVFADKMLTTSRCSPAIMGDSDSRKTVPGHAETPRSAIPPRELLRELEHDATGQINKHAGYRTCNYSNTRKAAGVDGGFNQRVY